MTFLLTTQSILSTLYFAVSLNIGWQRNCCIGEALFAPHFLTDGIGPAKSTLPRKLRAESTSNCVVMGSFDLDEFGSCLQILAPLLILPCQGSVHCTSLGGGVCRSQQPPLSKRAFVPLCPGKSPLLPMGQVQVHLAKWIKARKANRILTE